MGTASQKTLIHVVALFMKRTIISCKVRLLTNHFLTRCIRQFKLIGVLELFLKIAVFYYFDEPTNNLNNTAVDQLINSI